MIVTFNDMDFLKDMSNISKYSEGFLKGIQDGKPKFLSNLGKEVIKTLKEFIDSNARVDPASLSHVYEWYRSGSPDARLFDIDYKATRGGLSFNYTFSQSKSLRQGSNVPFYDKAEIMENGIPVTIVPRLAQVLVFEDNGETIFTKNPIEVTNPGGDQAKNGFRNIFDIFFSQYFTQAFLVSSGIVNYLNNPFLYSKNFKMAKSGGESLGYKTGIEFITKAATGGTY